MILISPEKVLPGDVVLVKRTGEGGMHFLIGRVAKVGEKQITVWGNWREERERAHVNETWEFTTCFDKEEPGVLIYKIGKWINGEVKTREGDACYLLDQIIMEAKSTGIVPVKMIEEAGKFLKGE